METIQERIAKEINQVPSLVNIGKRKFSVYPLGFGQIIDISAIVSKIAEVTQDDMGRDIITVNFEHMPDIEKMVDIAMIVICPDPKDRTDELRKYLRIYLNEENYLPLQEMYMQRLETGFFLNNIIFLKKYLNVPKPTKAIPPGQAGTEQ